MESTAQHARPPMRSSRATPSAGRNSRPCRQLAPNTAMRPSSDELSQFRTLLADDNELFRGFLRDILLRHFPFMLIAEAGSGDHALALDAELHPQLVFMDIKLPGRSGLDLTRQFKKSNPAVLIYLVTQDDFPEYRTAARECGADHVIVMGESSEAAIVAMVATTLSDRFPTSQLHGAEVRPHEECLPDLRG